MNSEPYLDLRMPKRDEDAEKREQRMQVLVTTIPFLF